MNLLGILSLITLTLVITFSLTSGISSATVKEFIRNKSNIEKNIIKDRNGIDMTKPYEGEVKVANFKEKTNNILLNVKNGGNIKIILQNEEQEPLNTPIRYQITFNRNNENLTGIIQTLETQRTLLNNSEDIIGNTINMNEKIDKIDINGLSGITNNGEINLFGGNYSVNIFIEKPVFYTIEKDENVIIENLKGLNLEYTNIGSEMKDFYHGNNYFIIM